MGFVAECQNFGIQLVGLQRGNGGPGLSEKS